MGGQTCRGTTPHAVTNGMAHVVARTRVVKTEGRHCTDYVTKEPAECSPNAYYKVTASTLERK